MKPVYFAVAALCGTQLCALTAQAQTDAALDQVIVTANNETQSLRNVTADVTVISGDEIRAKQYRTLDEVVASVAGFSVSHNGGLGTVTTMFLRGEGAKRILVLQDGVEMNDPMSVAGAHFENLQLNNIERIEIIRGAQSGVWGSGAMAGVINIITKPGGQQAQVDLQLGSYGTQKLSAALGAGNEQADFSIDFSRISTDGFSAVQPYKGSLNGLEDDAFEQTDIGFKLRVRPAEGQQIQFLTRSSDALSDYDLATDPNALYQSDYSNQIKQLQYQGQFEQFRAQAAVQKTDTSTTYSQGSLVKTNAKLGYDYAENHSLTLFAEHRNLTSDTNPANDYEHDGYGLAHSSRFLADRWIWDLSVRNDLYDRFKDKVTGKVGSKFYLQDDWYLSANYGTAYRAPSLAEQAYTYLGTLDSETKEGYDISLGSQNFSLSYYRSEYDNEIDWDSSLGSFGSYANLNGKSIYEGIELSYRNSIESWNLDYAFNFTQQTAKDGQGMWLARRPEQMANLQLDYFGFDRSRVGMELRYVGTQYDMADQKGAQIGEYLITDISADYRATANITLYAKVMNLFDEDYTTAVASPRDGSITPTYVYGNGGRQYSIGISGHL
ncbi:TonB-dependent receptor plug domain-containing protein [Thiomicrorhabdus heinhorstiae]|uniref:TonB-dependent receptor n=1 Tax=Thiomicrorhabdus heinhorstiae TaxID=2748010 RepID=A0ABS0BUN6_9GAMM|nr:TonB-dependent receptor [Thiomicrorhabdus heinhorstiae]MBF6057039.1 TonB-dependent receptor [Thiomicrorhabdus heinhorstiae]